jgi:hypothetical protein
MTPFDDAKNLYSDAQDFRAWVLTPVLDSTGPIPQ